MQCIIIFGLIKYIIYNIVFPCLFILVVFHVWYCIYLPHVTRYIYSIKSWNFLEKKKGAGENISVKMLQHLKYIISDLSSVYLYSIPMKGTLHTHVYHSGCISNRCWLEELYRCIILIITFHCIIKYVHADHAKPIWSRNKNRITFD